MAGAKKVKYIESTTNMVKVLLNTTITNIKYVRCLLRLELSEQEQSGRPFGNRKYIMLSINCFIFRELNNLQNKKK